MAHVHINLPLIEAFGDFADIARCKLAMVQADGTYPYLVRTKIAVVPEDNELETLGYQLDCATSTQRADGVDFSRFYTHPSGHCMYIERNSRDEINIAVAASDDAAARAEIERISEGRQEEVDEVDPNIVHVYFNWYGSNGTKERRRSIESPQWEDVRENYTPSTRDALERLHAFTPEGGVGGRLVMFHGDPGTGKTTAVRALARSWSSWCSTSYVIDPETLFNVPEYLIEIGVESIGRRRGRLQFMDLEDGDGDNTAQDDAPWKLIVVEDVDELIRADAKVRTGQALSRLLNMTDGLMGQGLRTLFLLTTNEPMAALHPAISRPGRCLANIEFTQFTKAEAAEWAKRGGTSLPDVHQDSYTLAQLYSLCAGGVITAARTATDRRPGTYL